MIDKCDITVMNKIATPIQSTREDEWPGLRTALTAAGFGDRVLTPMADTGLAHDHIWLKARRDDQADWVARLPKQSQLDLDAKANLSYQACCFERAAASGHTPSLGAVLPPEESLPRGGLVIAAVQGHAPRLPEDLTAIAHALASLHRLPLPSPEERAPLLDPVSPWGDMLEEVSHQAAFLPQAGLDDDTLGQLQKELAELSAWVETQPTTAKALISFDAHPGNFLIDPQGRAILVDLEKCRYSLPGLDLAHASLYTSTTWDTRTYAELSVDEVHALYREWVKAIGNHREYLDPQGLLQCRRAMWLWSVTWCAKWRSKYRRRRDEGAGGEDWSAELSDPALIDHVRDRVDHYLSPQIISRVREEWHELARRDLLD